MTEVFLKTYVDYGTCYLSVGQVLLPKDHVAQPDDLNILQLQERRKERSPQLCGYFREGEGAWSWIHGHALERISREDKSHHSVRSFRKLKIAVLGTGPEADHARETINRELAELRVEEKNANQLFVRHLIEIKRDVETASEKVFGSTDLARFKRWTYWFVPEVADPGKTQVLSLLLQRASWGDFSIASETEAAGSWIVSKHLRCEQRRQRYGNSTQSYTPGDEIVVCDGGGWTFNTASYVVVPTRGIEAIHQSPERLPLKPTGKYDSRPYGSEMISESLDGWCRDFAKNEYGSVEACIKQLAIPPHRFESELWQMIDNCKCDFKTDSRRAFHGVIQGALTTRKDRRRDATRVEFPLQHELLLTRFRDAVEKIKSCIDPLITAQTKVIILTGGLFRSSYMEDSLQKAYALKEIPVILPRSDSQSEADLPVVRGAAARYTLEPVDSPFPYCLGIAQDEFWDPQDHPDVSKHSKQIVRNPDKDPWVPGRWKTLLPLGYNVNSHRDPEPCDAHLIVELPGAIKKTFTYAKSIFWTKEQIPDHKRVLDGEEPPSPLADLNLHEYGLPIEFSIPLSDLERIPRIRGKLRPTRKGWSKQPARDERLLYLNVRTIIRGVHISVEVSRVPFEYDPENKMTGELIYPPDDQMTHLWSSCLHGPGASAFLQRLIGDGNNNLDQLTSHTSPDELAPTPSSSATYQRFDTPPSEMLDGIVGGMYRVQDGDVRAPACRTLKRAHISDDDDEDSRCSTSI